MTETSNNTGDSESKNYFLDRMVIVAKHSLMIVSISATIAVLTYLYFFCSPNEFKAIARLMPPQQNLTMSAQLLDALGARMTPGGGGSGSGGGGVGGMAASFLGLKSPSDLYVAMITIDRVLDRIIDRFHLLKVYEIKSREKARKKLRGFLDVSAGKKDGIIVIEVISITPKLAAEIANAFIEELDRLLQELAVQEAKGRLTFFEKERLQANENLIKTEEALRLFSERHGVIQLDTQARGTIQYIAQLRAEIDTKEVSLQVLRGAATPFNYDVVRMETEVKGLKEKLRNAESQFENCLSDVCLPSSKAPGLGLEYLRLFRETKFQENLYQLYTRLVEVARLDIARNVVVVQVLSSAVPPEFRSNTRVKQAILVGMCTFIVLIMMAFVREYIQNMQNNEDEVHRIKVLKGYLTPWTDSVKRIRNIIFFKQ